MIIWLFAQAGRWALKITTHHRLGRLAAAFLLLDNHPVLIEDDILLVKERVLNAYKKLKRVRLFPSN